MVLWDHLDLQEIMEILARTVHQDQRALQDPQEIKDQWVPMVHQGQ